MRTGITKMQKVTEVYYNAKDPIAGVYTHDTKQKKAAACRSSPDHWKRTDGSAATRHFSCIVLVCIHIYIHTSLFETMRIEVYEMRLHICLKCANSLC